MSVARGESLAVESGVQRWWMLVLLGVVSIAAGIVAIAYTALTLLVVGLIFGINLLIWGFGTLVAGLQPGETAGMAALHMFTGFISLLAGLLCVVHPGLSVLLVLLVVGFWFVLVGASDLTLAIHHSDHRLAFSLLGIAGIAAGIIIVANPDIGLNTLALLVGIGFLVRGTLAVTAGMQLRNA